MVDEARQEDNLEPTPYHNAYRKDLDKPVETETVETKDTEEATPKKTTGFVGTEKTSQEHDFKKRYDDLKSHYDKKVNEWKEKDNNFIKNQESLKRANYAPPKSLEELEQFKQDYPDVYEVVESVSHLQANDRVKDIESRLGELREQEVELTKQNSLKEFPKFMNAVKNEDYATMGDEYHRTAKDEDGNELKGIETRNKEFFRRFISPYLQDNKF